MLLVRERAFITECVFAVFVSSVGVCIVLLYRFSIHINPHTLSYFETWPAAKPRAAGCSSSVGGARNRATPPLIHFISPCFTPRPSTIHY